ncbi:MAG: nucleotidyltransferase domain-containing protein [Bacteroidota bacterium]|nr:nucleotidyltransferase domain-containing protein [Bacteroidota bacterium]
MNTLREIEITNMIKSVCRQNRHLLINNRVILFGSRASGQNKKHSDFDIGILGEKSLSIADFYKLKDALDELPTLYTIDLVDFNKVSKSFRNEALKNYSVLYA